jgi:TatD-related deoxyribonuclease
VGGLPADLPVVDHHCHLSPNGEGVTAARRFAAEGGTHLFVATQGYEPGAPLDLAGYERQYATTEALARRVEEAAGLRAYPVIAPYPVDLLRQAERMGAEAAVALHERALELAGRWVEEGRAVALGEVGRPHFPYPPELAEPVEAVLRRALEVGRDAGCPVVLHTGDLDEAGFRELAGLAARNGFPPAKLVKHYHRRVLSTEAYAGLTPSYLARREVVAKALGTPGPWFLETDFLDDPARPGAVLDLATVARRASNDLARHPEHADLWRVPFQSSIASVYGFTPEIDRRDRP